MAFNLAKAGYGGGDPEKVLQMPVSMVVMAEHYEIFCRQYERQFYFLNKADK